jgi:exodeoxyribonuclease VII large subunit
MPFPLDSPIYTISQLTAEIQAVLEEKFPSVWVEGEISNYHLHSSGHMYFSLKDESATLRSAMFRAQNRNLKISPQDGLQVIAFGRISVYPPRGDYQLIIEYLEPKGVGALHLAFLQLKERLEKEGLFDPAHKKPLPMLPKRIGIITSPTGAAIRDIMQILERRFAEVEILIYPVLVQGPEAAGQIAQALYDMNQRGDTEVLIVGRGGGSLEDLWAFNEEVVARAIFASGIPVISAVGHEIDITIADLVADVRAPTPSAAAELVIARKEEVAQRLDDYWSRLILSWEGKKERRQTRLMHSRERLKLLSPLARLERTREALEGTSRSLWLFVQQRLQEARTDFTVLAGKLDSLSPLAVLARGYSITRLLSAGEIVKDIKQVKPQDELSIRLHRGEITAKVNKVKGSE